MSHFCSRPVTPRSPREAPGIDLLFTITRLTEFIPIFPDEQSALAEVGKPRLDPNRFRSFVSLSLFAYSLDFSLETAILDMLGSGLAQRTSDKAPAIREFG